MWWNLRKNHIFRGCSPFKRGQTHVNASMYACVNSFFSPSLFYLSPIMCSIRMVFVFFLGIAKWVCFHSEGIFLMRFVFVWNVLSISAESNIFLRYDNFQDLIITFLISAKTLNWNKQSYMPLQKKSIFDCTSTYNTRNTQ